MSNLGALARIAAARVPRAQPWVGVRPETLRLIELQTHDLLGNPLGRDPAREGALKDLLQSATPVMRRKSLTDLLAGKLQSVHESGRTGAAAGAKRSIEARERLEPGLFGDKGQIYGMLLSDPRNLSQLTERYPDKGTIIQSNNGAQQYGRYGLVPRDKHDRSTFTLGDSLDNSKAGPLSPYDTHEFMTDLEHPYTPNWFGSALWEMSDDVVNRSNKVKTGLGEYADDQIYRAHGNEFRDALRELGAAGLEPPYGRSYYVQENFRLLPRRLDNPFQVPMTPSERTNSLRGEKTLANPDLGYIEYQLHGDVTPDRIAKVLDYGIAPSTSTEKKLRKLGIDYEPVVGPDALLAQFSALKKRDAELSEWLAAMEARKHEASDYLLKALPDWANNPARFKMLRVADHYATGGAV
jgi:hypothetical protein